MSGSKAGNFFCLVLVSGCVFGLASCGGNVTPGPPPPPPAACDLTQAPELLSVTVQNSGADALHDYPVAVFFDQSTFDFSKAAADGSDLAAWDPQTGNPLPSWLESYDSSLGKGLLWVKLASLPAQGSQTVWLSAGSTAHCSPLAGNGYSVFPFFSDVNDVNNWTSTGHLKISDTLTISPLTVQDRKVITGDGTYNSTPAVAQAQNGDWVLTYRKGSGHLHVPDVVLRRSADQGQTWEPEVIYFNTSGPDPALVRTPGGDLIIEFVKLDPNSVAGAAYSRSTDNGLTWGPFTFFDSPPDATSALASALFTNGPTMYAGSYGPSTFDNTDSPFFWQSDDDGLTWTKLSELRQPGDPGMNEISTAQTGPASLFATLRTDSARDTFGRYSSDQGQTWGPLLSYTSQVGVMQGLELIQAGPAVLLLGRETSGLQNAPGLPQGSARQLAVFVSYDGGQNFDYGTVLEDYTGAQEDGGYCWPMLLPDGRVFVAYYADSNGLRMPDIKSLTLQLTPPGTAPSTAIHVTNRAEPDLAQHSLSLSSTRYSLDFRFRSREIPVGTQFAVSLRGADGNGQPVTLVNWELPSTQAADPGNFSGINANNQFVPVLNSFAWDQIYRIRTIVDETQAQQEGQVLDPFGAVLNTSGPEPLAQGIVGHPSTVLIGNNADRRATDTLLDFIFTRPLADVEPQVTVSRVH